MPCRVHTFKTFRYAIRSQWISQFYLHSPHSSANWMNNSCLFLPSWNWSSFSDPGGMEGWVGLTGWLRTEINVRHRELNTVTNPSTGRVWHRLTVLIEINALPLCLTTTIWVTEGHMLLPVLDCETCCQLHCFWWTGVMCKVLISWRHICVIWELFPACFWDFEINLA